MMKTRRIEMNYMSNYIIFIDLKSMSVSVYLEGYYIYIYMYIFLYELFIQEKS